MKIQVHTMELAGTSYEIGHQLGSMVMNIPALRQVHIHASESDRLKPEEMDEAIRLFDRWCPGLTEELHGFASALSIKPEQVVFYAMTYLLPRCSQMAILPQGTKDGKPLLARNYEFSHMMEDFCLIRTSVKGKYTHLGTSVLQFGREDGFNDQGLSVTMSSCGFPVGSNSNMKSPKLKGLQFWAVIRALLENCRDVSEALDYLKEMPIAFNINLMLMDKNGNAALYETVDGHCQVRRADRESEESALFATNHAVFPEMRVLEPMVMNHSARRYDYIQACLSDQKEIDRNRLKHMLLSMYPDGLCCHYFEEFFGTTKSMVISPVDGTLELCWGGNIENGWNMYSITDPLDNVSAEKHIILDKAKPGTYESREI